MRHIQGFTFIELVLVLAIIGVLSAVAIPAYTDYVKRSQVTEGIELGISFKQNVSDYYAWHGEFPSDNRALGLPDAKQLQGNYVKAIAIQAGNIHVYYGNRVGTDLQGKAIVLSPQQAATPLATQLRWQCHAKAIESAYLPTRCKT